MIEALNALSQYVNASEVQDAAALRKLRLSLYQLLQSVDKKLETIEDTKPLSKRRCPKCSSRNIRVHAKNPVVRFRCTDCSYTFSKSQSPLYYRRKKTKNDQSVLGLLEFIIEIRQTDKSISEIREAFNISLTTYYAWRKSVLEIFPQMEENFAQRRKKAAKFTP